MVLQWLMCSYRSTARLVVSFGVLCGVYLVRGAFCVA